MSRRGMASRIHLPIASVLKNPRQEWGTLTRGVIKTAADRKLAVDWDQYSNDNYLFVHSTIVSSVNVADNGYYIDPVCDELVNSNGNAWATPLLLATFKSFIGKNNYQEHVQIPALSKGTILDAVARPVKYVASDGSGKTDVVYVDILVAVDRKHSDLCSRIGSGEMDSMSMGTLAHWVTCSRCGGQFDDDMTPCDHIQNDLMEHFTDENGVRRITAELCGRMIKNPETGLLEPDVESNEFIEASWVEKPAFKGAVINHYISDMDVKVAKILEFPTDQFQLALDDMFKVRVADRQGAMVLRILCRELRAYKKQELVERVARRSIA